MDCGHTYIDIHNIYINVNIYLHICRYIYRYTCKYEIYIYTHISEESETFKEDVMVEVARLRHL